MLTDAQIKSLNKTRTVLDDLEQRCGDDPRFAKGKVAEACRAAETAIFNVLSLLNANSIQKVSTSELYNEVGSTNGTSD